LSKKINNTEFIKQFVQENNPEFNKLFVQENNPDFVKQYTRSVATTLLLKKIIMILISNLLKNFD
jgi:hypothetical protein